MVFGNISVLIFDCCILLGICRFLLKAREDAKINARITKFPYLMIISHHQSKKRNTNSVGQVIVQDKSADISPSELFLQIRCQNYGRGRSNRLSRFSECRVIRIAPFANRLSMNVPSHIQLLRCIANYKALKFSPPISSLAEKLVSRMIERSSMTGGKYISVHLRFEEDMVAFSCCVYDGEKAEKFKMDSFREIGWKGKFKRKDRVIVPALNRVEGKCPLTPVEVPNESSIFVLFFSGYGLLEDLIQSF